MSLTSGTRLGPYEVVALIGAGGMGEVYRARDSKLNRDVALKILPGEFAADADRLARFKREAQVLASLNHPNIAAIYGFEDSGSTHALVLELIEGPTLADRIARGPIALDEAVPIAKQIAEALEAAHDQGIVHRDLKPANVKVTTARKVKVLDFGLAKVAEPALTGNLTASPTLMHPGATTAGSILGTVAYMSPEQTRGRLVDKRADVWAFGAILYEMLTGRQAFSGETISDTIVSVLSREVEWRALPSGVPPRIHRLLRRCLQRDANDRLRDIGDARIELADALSGAPDAAAEAAVARGGARSRLPAAVGAVAGLLIGAGVVLAVRGWRPQPQGAASWTASRLGGANVAWTPRASPDGKTLAYLAFVEGQTQVAIMNPESGNWTQLTKDRTRGYVSWLAWSRDGTRIYFNRLTDVPVGVFTIPALGGEERLVLEGASGAEALPDGSLIVARINANRKLQLQRYWPGDGRLTDLPGIMTDMEPFPLRLTPDGSRALFRGQSVDQPSSDPDSHIYSLDIASGTVSRFAPGGAPGRPTLGRTAALAITPAGRTVVLSESHGDLSTLVEVEIDHPERSRTLFPLTQAFNQFDVGPDGSVYINEQIREPQVWRFGPDGSNPERLNSFPDLHVSYAGSGGILHSPEGRTWMVAKFGGRQRLMAAEAGKEAAPFVQTDEETGGPMTFAGPGRVAFFIGSGDNWQVAIASQSDGRIVQRLRNVPARQVTGITATRDGRVLFMVRLGAIWRVPADDSAPVKIHNGDGVTLGADGQSLIIQLIESGGIRWIRTDLEGKNEQPIVVKGDWRFTFQPIGAGAVAPDGRIALPIATRDQWFWPAAILEPRSGEVRRIPLPFYADVPVPTWMPDGKIVAMTFPLSSSLWRFKPEASAR